MTQKLRSGFTTGACAAASAKAAAIAFVNGERPNEVTITLPRGQAVTFPVEWDGKGRAVVVKDAGDDPDCTDGARLTAEIEALEDEEHPLVVAGGEGVGIVTKPGLGLAVGEPAINPVPRQMILSEVSKIIGSGVKIIISVPGGEEMATRTTNSRLGIVGGISILGTTGIVKPFSTASYRASIVQQIDVAAVQGERHIVLATGSRTEQCAMGRHSQLDAVCFVEVGDFTGVALKRCASKEQIEQISYYAMAGKMTKIASGVFMTHFHRSDVDTSLLERMAIESGSSPSIIASARQTKTARHFYETCRDQGNLAALERLTELAAETAFRYIAGKKTLTMNLVDPDNLEVACSASRLVHC